MTKRFIFLLMLIMTVLITSCSKPQVSEITDGITVTDCAGRTVTVPRNPERVACLYAYTGHGCALFDSTDKIVAVVDGLKRDTLMQEKIPDIANLPSPYTKGSINIEELAAAKPDLILLRLSNIQDKGEIEKLDTLGVPYVVVDYSTMAEQIKSIELMGEVLGKHNKAKEYIDYYNDTIQMVSERVQSIPDEKRIKVFHSVNEAVRTDIPGTLTYEILEIAGLKNAVNSENDIFYNEGKAYTTVEQIFVWDPDIILVNEPSALEYFKTNQNFAGLRAVRDGELYQLPVGISRWAHPGSIESPIAALWIAKAVYPEYFEDIDMDKEVTEFYDKFFSVKLTKENLESIYSGNGMRQSKN